MTKPKAKPPKPKLPVSDPQSAPLPVCIMCTYANIQGDTPYCDHPVVKSEHDPVRGAMQPTCIDERTLAPTAANRRVCGHEGRLFERRAQE